jgi:hypothetical protein
MRSRSKDRLGDNLSFRLSREQRDFLEMIAEQNDVAISEAARICINSEMARAGAMQCLNE